MRRNKYSVARAAKATITEDLKCQFCDREPYKTLKGYVNHLKTKHPDESPNE